ncbi:MAG: hypothetical protein ABFD69_09495 [Candidatus Sumerlaeia bacterium]
MLEPFANIVMNVWTYAGVVLFVYGWLNYPILAAFACHRVAQLRDRDFDLRPTVPTHAALHNYCAILYGVVLPAFYFLTVRLRHELALWRLGPNVNRRWTIALGVVCMVWLAGHVIRAIRSRDRLRFGGRADRIVAGLGFLLCLWFHFWTVTNLPVAMINSQFRGMPAFWQLVWMLFYPQSHFLGATLVFGFAFGEACRNPAPFAPTRRGLAYSACAVALIFAPWWLSLPRVTHDQALKLIRANLGAITQAGEEARIDPRLIAGIIYVAQTRDHPRWTGDFIDSFGLELDAGSSIFAEMFPVFDGSVGLCQMKPSTYGYIRIWWLNSKPAAENDWPPPYEKIRLYQWSKPGTGPRGINRDGIRCLKDPKTNLAVAVFMLHLLGDQWSKAGRPIDDRPEILATLYNIGFERSRPKADPRPNDFGRRVKAFMDSPDCNELFESATNHKAEAK